MFKIKLKTQPPTNRFLLAALTAWSLLGPAPSRADERAYNTSGVLDWFTMEERRPFFQAGNWSPFLGTGCPITSDEGASFDFYTGFGLDAIDPLFTYWHWSTWPIYYPGNAAGGYVSINYLGSTTSGHGGNGGEGTGAGVNGLPVFGFETNVWYRFVVRCWRPADGTPHLGYAGQWIRESVGGTWYHCATLQAPLALQGISGGTRGFMEERPAAQGNLEIDFRNAFAHEFGQPSTLIQQANAITIDRNNGGYNALIENGTAVMSWVDWATTPRVDPLGHYYTNNMTYDNGWTATLRMTNQPAAPAFDPIIVNNYGALVSGSQLLVQWQLPATSSPQLRYRIEVFNNASYSGAPALDYLTADPEARQKLLNLAGIPSPHVRLTIMDIFDNTNTPILITPSTLALNPATNVAGVVPGLNYRYFTTNGLGLSFTNLPDLGALTPALQGAVNYLDLSVRTNRSEYALSYSGFFQAPSNGIYTFTLTSFDSSRLVIDGQTVVDFNGLHQPGNLPGAVGLQAGLHAVNIQYAFSDQRGFCTDWDGVWLACEGPGIINSAVTPDATCVGLTTPEYVSSVPVPANAWFRLPLAGEPSLALTSPVNGGTAGGSNLLFQVAIAPHGATNIAKVQYYWAGTFLGESTSAPYSMNLLLGAAQTNYLHAMLWYNGGNSVDSAPASVAAITNMDVTPWVFTSVGQPPIYPAGGRVAGGTMTLRGDAFNMMSRQVTGDCTFIARLADLTSAATLPDGTTPDPTGMAGIILRDSLGASSDPLGGDGTNTSYFAVFEEIGGGTYYEDPTLVDGNYAPNQTSVNLGIGYNWLRLQRIGSNCLTSISADGSNWKLVNNHPLGGLGPTLYAGLFVNTSWNALLPYIPFASFDNVSLTGNVLGPPTASVSPASATNYQGGSVSLQAAVVGQPPFSYRWRKNGTNLTAAAGATLTLTNLQVADSGVYSVLVSTLGGSCVSAGSSLTVVPATELRWDANPVAAGAQDGAGSWGGGGNWWNGSAAVAWQDANLATFGVDTATNCTVRLVQDVAPLGITFDTAGGGTYTLGGTNVIWAANGPLTIEADSPGIINAPIGGTNALIKTGPSLLTLAADNPLGGSLLVNAGTLVLSTPNFNTYRGSVISIQDHATLKLSQTGGAGRYDFGGVLFGFDAAGGDTIDTSAGVNMVFQGGGNTFVTAGGSQDSIIGSSGMNLNYRTATFNLVRGTDPSDLRITAPLSNLGNVVEIGNGILELAGANTYSGTTTVSGGTLLVDTAIGSGVLTVQPGATIGRAGPLGTLALGASPVLTGTVALRIDRTASPNADKLVASGLTLTYSGALYVSNVGGSLAANDAFTLFNAASLTGSFSTMVLPPLAPGLAWNTSNLFTTGTINVAAVTGGNAPATPPTNLTLVATSPGQLNLAWSPAPGATSYVVSRGGIPLATVVGTNYVDSSLSPGASYCYAVAAANGGGSSTPSADICLTLPMVGQGLTWDANSGISAARDGDGTWDNGARWWNGSAAVAWQDANVATFGVNTATNCTVTLGRDVAPSGITFNATGGGTYTLNGTNSVWTTNAVLTLDAEGDGIFNAPISGTAPMIKTGPGTITLNANNPFAGNMLIDAGTLALNTPDYNTYQGTGIFINNGSTFKVTQTGGNTRYDFGDAWFTFDPGGGGTIDTSTGVNFVVMGGGDTFVTGGGARNLITGSSGINLNYRTATFNLARGTDASDLKIEAPLWNVGSLVENGAGILELAGANTYSGATTISGGTLWVNGSLANSAVTVQSGATLGGAGGIGGPVTLETGATLAPGTIGVGTLSTGTNFWFGGAAYAYELNGVAPTNSDQLNISGALICQATAANPFTVKLVSLTAQNLPGPAPNFNKLADYAWTNTITTAGISNFDTNSVVVDTSAFSNDFSGGHFSLTNDGRALILRYTPPLVAPMWLSFGPTWSGAPALQFTGTSGSTYRVLTSTNLLLPLTNWTQLTTGTFGADPVLYTDAPATNLCKFYLLSRATNQ